MSVARRIQLRAAAQNTGEIPDNTPVELVGGNDNPLSLREEMRRFIRGELSTQQAAAGHGSFEDEDDFTEDEDSGDLTTNYTVQELVPEGDKHDTLEGDPDYEEKHKEPLPASDEATLQTSQSAKPSLSEQIAALTPDQEQACWNALKQAGLTPADES